MKIIKIGLIIVLGLLVTFISESPLIGSELIEPRTEVQEREIEENTTSLQSRILSCEEWEKRLGESDDYFSVELLDSLPPYILVSDQIKGFLTALFFSITKPPFYILYCSLDIDS